MSNNRIPIVIAIVVGVISLGAIGFLIKQNLDLKKQSEDYEYQMEDLNVEILDLEDNLKDLETDIESQDVELKEKDRLLAEREQELLDKQKKIDVLLKNNRITKAEAEELRTKIDQLNYYVKKYQVKIDSLTAEVELLTGENQNLKENLATLEDKTFELEQKTDQQGTLLEIAAILSANQFQFARVKGSGKEKFETEFRGGRLDQLRSCFVIAKNTVAKAGSRDLFLTIYDPKGNPVVDMGGQSGNFVYEGADKLYSVREKINYDKTTTNVCIDYMRPDGQDFEKGTYTVRIYCEDFEIGSGNFDIK